MMLLKVCVGFVALVLVLIVAAIIVLAIIAFTEELFSSNPYHED